MSADTATTRIGDGAALQPGANVVLCADDFAMTDGVSRGIEELALARRLSATSAIVTLPGFEQHARRLAELRSFVAIGLHINLTLGAPLAPMPGLAPDGELPDHTDLVRMALMGRVVKAEIAAEIERQFARFEEGTGFMPDFIDGHQHVHTLPGIRAAVLDVLARRQSRFRPLVRDPVDGLSAILHRRAGAHKALAIALLSRGFGARARAAGFPTNHGFSGVSAFDMDSRYEGELEAFFERPGRRHLVMCHPGYADPVLADLDSVVARRHQELDALFAMPRLDEAIWHVRRRADGPPVDWQEALPV